MTNHEIKVLVIEDNPGDARLIREMLGDVRSIRFNMECVDRLSTGLGCLARGGTDALLLDLSLPDSQGLDTFARAHAAAPEVAIVVLSGSADEDVALKAVQEGAQDYLVKGQADGASLSRALRYAIERKRTEKALHEANQRLTGWLSELESRSRETSLLNEMAELLQSCLTADEAYTIIARSVRQLFPLESGQLYLVDVSRNLAEAVAVWGDPLPGEHVFAPQECWALRRGRPHRVEDPNSAPNCQHVGPPLPAAYLCVPLMAHGEAFGILHLQNPSHNSDEPAKREGCITEPKERLAMSIAEHAGLALANLKLQESLLIQSIRDPLTGLFNRRHLEETLERELRRAARNQRFLGAIMLDIDYFKQFNDTYGHGTGDALLRELGKFIQVRMRKEDIAYRYGGEEFTLILPETSLEVTRRRAERLREDVKCLGANLQGLSVKPVTLSFGVAGFPEHGATAAELLRAADEALYRAKATGRDRVVVSPNSIESS
jgi:diguanylate cyclase (GGDEF)-like protein